MSATAPSASMLPAPNTRRWALIALGLVLIVILGYVLTVQVTVGGIKGVDSFGKAASTPTFPTTLAINYLVGISFLLYILETGWETLRVILTIVAALLIGFVIMLFISKDPLKAYQALLFGPLSRLNRWGGWIDDSLGMVLVGLAIAIVFRARLFSLGAEGQIYLGAMAAGLVALFVTGLPSWLHISLALIAGCVVGFLWGLIPGILRAYLDANELVSTLMLNPIAALIYALLLTPLKPPTAGYIVSATFPDDALLPRIIAGTRITTAVYFVIAAVIATWLLIQRTPLGYEIRMIGLNMSFARYGGVKDKRTIVLAMGLSGILAGLMGGYLALAIHQRLIVGISSGLAFEGIVVALLARNKPLAVPAMALVYSYLRVGGPIMQTDASVSLEIVRVIQAIIILLFTAEGLITFWQARHTIKIAQAVDASAEKPENTLVEAQKLT